MPPTTPAAPPDPLADPPTPAPTPVPGRDDAPAAFRLAPRVSLRHRVLRAFFLAASLASLVAAGASFSLASGMSEGLRWLMSAAYVSLSAACLVATRLAPRQADRALPVLSLGCLLMVGSLATANGWGLAAPGLAFFGLIVGLVNAVSRRNVGGWVTAGAVLVVGALAGVEWLGWTPQPLQPDRVPVLVRLLVLWATIGAAAAGGRALAAMLSRHLAVANARERRFQALLGIAASAYWETDASLQLRHVTWRRRDGEFAPLADVRGLAPWDLSALVMDDEGLDAVRADMESHAVLSDVPFAWRLASGELRHFLGSGRPRLDARGRLLGYWGVARDVSAEHQARAALQATERRYHDLFMRLPTPLLLHRQGRIIDANPAAAQLLGYGAVARLLGRHLLDEHMDADARALARERVAQAEALQPGEALPTTTLQMRTVQGGILHVRATGTRTEADGQPAMLSMLIDETASVRAARSQQRTEALFAQVLSISPDVITLTDMSNGHYLLVNDSFTELTGFTAEEAVGHSALDLGIWHRLADRTALLALVQARGAVQNVTVEFVNKHGAVFPLLVSASRFERDGRQLLVINARQPTEVGRLRIEREAILDNASVGIAFTRMRHFVMVNPQFERIYGWPAGALVGRSGREVWASDEAYESLGSEIGPALRRGEAVEIEREARRHDGSQFLVRLRAKALDPLHPGEHGTIWIAEDVTKARQDAQALADARDAAEAASRAKSAFLANTSHEIRTPLNGLLGLARLARQPGVTPQRRRDYLDQIADSAETLSMIISDILDLSKIEAGKLEVTQAPFDLRDLMHGLHQAYAALAAGHGLAFAMAMDQGLPQRVRGDALRVRQILANYLQNALKFTASGSIRLVVQGRPGGWVRFEVHDTGPGIAAEAQARLFQPFTQADDSTTRRYGGTGLGLSICQQLATLMGGQVGLHSQPGQGSCFFAELPLPADTGVGRPVPDLAHQSAVLQGARVLLVEDNLVNMMIGVALLEQWGVQVIQATDGALALQAVDQARATGAPVQVVLMDVQMPGMGGHEATAALRQRYSAAELPVIALTAAALVSERERALATGMNDFITKPIDPQRLRDALVRVLSPLPAATVVVNAVGDSPASAAGRPDPSPPAAPG